MILVRFIFVLLCIVIVALFAVKIRTENPQLFYECRKSKVQKDNIELELKMLKVEIESFNNPINIKSVLEQSKENDETVAE